MADININREAFVPPAMQPPKSSLSGIGIFILVLALAASGVAGYKIIVASTPSVSKADSQNLLQIQKQLTDIEKRLEKLEKRHSVSARAALPPPLNSKVAETSEMIRPVRHEMKNTATESPSTQTSQRSSLNAQSSSLSAGANLPGDDGAASREAWQATTDRLADIVGTVGSQQGEISQDRQELGQLVAQTRRTAIQFELHRGADPQLIGPVSMQLKKSDSKSKRYTVCVYLEDKCVELKDRAADEVVYFVPSAGAAPLRLVATKVDGNAIAGYMEVPLAKPIR